MNKKNVLVLCIDRDNDLGVKAKVKGPVIGVKENIDAATKLALADPTDTDSNTIFAAVKVCEDLKKEFNKVVVVTLTGKQSVGVKSDQEINKQLDLVTHNTHFDGVIFVTDGAEDDAVIPLIQNKLKLISKQLIIVKQSKALESTYYTLIEGLKDPSIARVAFGIPGTILLLFVLFGFFGLQLTGFILGVYLLLKGIGLEETVVHLIKRLTSPISLHKNSFPLFMAFVLLLLFAFISLVNTFNVLTDFSLLNRFLYSIQTSYFFIVLASLFFISGKCIDLIYFKKAFLIKKYFFMAVSILLFWFILDSITSVLLGELKFEFFIFSVLISFILLLIVFKILSFFEIRNKVTKLLLNLPVYNKDGSFFGVVKSVNLTKSFFSIKLPGKKKPLNIFEKQFFVRKGVIYLI